MTRLLLLSLAACGPTEQKPGAEDTSAPDETGDTGAPEDTGDTGAPDETGQGAEVIPTEVDGQWVFTAGDLVLAVDATRGARITRFSLGGVELLTDETVDADNWGATFWTAPQYEWTWPPPPAIDTEPYAATLDGTTLVLTSGPATVGDATFTVEKRISVGAVVTATYTIRNTGETDAGVAGWQVTRVPADGLTVFPAGNHVTGTLGTLPYDNQDGHIWISEIPAVDSKVIADASGGWLAHAANGVVLVQRFDDVRLGDAAPGHGEVEVYAKGGGGYREIEVQSAYTTVAPGDALTWTVTWEAREVPADVPVEVGSAGLLELIGG